jgi:nucleoporin SEH1
MGEVLGSVAEDGRFILWQENATEIPGAGRRFSNIYEQRSSTNVPFMSLDFKNINTETWVALTTRDGYLTVLEPLDHEILTSWQSIYGNYLVTTPDREDETSFKVAFHKEKLPSWTAVRAGLDRKALSLAVASMNTVKVFRANKDNQGNYRFYLAAELTGARALVRDVAWANGSMRGWDVIATGSKDGCVRIYELRPDAPGAGIDSSTAATLPEIKEPTNNQNRGTRNAPSGIGAGLASGSGGRDSYRDVGSSSGGIKEIATMTEELNLHRGAVWRVAFSQGGEVLVATGDDGAVITWKRAMSGRWLEYAEVNVTSD